MSTLIRIDTTCFFQRLVHIECCVGVWKSWVLWNTKFIMYSSNYLYMFYLLLIKNSNSMMLPWFLVILLFMKYQQKKVDWKKRKYRSGATEFFTHGKKETKHIKIFSKFPNGFLSIWWGPKSPNPPLWSLF